MLMKYLTNAKKEKYTKEQAMKILLKEPVLFLNPVPFVLFVSDSGLDINLQQYSTIIVNQARKKRNYKLFELAKQSYEIGKLKEL